MKKRILGILITLVMLIGLVTVMSVSASAAGGTSEIHWAVVQKDSDVILYLGNAAHVMQTGETLYADGAQGINNMVLAIDNMLNNKYEAHRHKSYCHFLSHAVSSSFLPKLSIAQPMLKSIRPTTAKTGTGQLS